MYYTISRQATVRHKNKLNEEEHYDYIEGLLTDIKLIEDEYDGDKRYVWHLVFEPEDGTYQEILQVGESSSAARGIIRSLFSVQGPIGWVKIGPYSKKPEGYDKAFTNVWFEHEGHTVEWLPQLLEHEPDTEEHYINEKPIIDDTKRRHYYRKLVKRIVPRLSGQRQHPSGPKRVDQETGEVTREEEESQQPRRAGAGRNPERPEPAQQEPHPADRRQVSDNTYGKGQGAGAEQQGPDLQDWDDVDDDLPF